MSFSPTPRLSSSHLFASQDQKVTDDIFQILKFYNPTLRSKLNINEDIAKQELYDAFVATLDFLTISNLNENCFLIVNIYSMFKKLSRTKNETVLMAYEELYEKFIARNRLLKNNYDILAVLFFSNENYSKDLDNLCITMKLAGEWN